MRLFDEKKLLRFLLVFASVFFAVFIPEFLGTTSNPFLVIPYILADIFLVMVAVGYRFPVVGNNKKMREDIVIEPPATTSTVAVRDFHKDLIEKDELLQMMVDVSASAFWTFDVVTGKVYWSNKAAKLLQVNANMLDDSFNVIKNSVVDGDWDRFREAMNVALEMGTNFTVELCLKKSEVHGKTLSISGNIQKNDEGRSIRIVGALSEIKNEESTERQKFYVYQDSLTGVYNRKFFLEKLKTDLDIARQRPDYLFAVALLDIDSFGAINASYSSNVGDSVLQVVADRIKSQCRSNDSIARIGPDVFAVVLHNIQSGDADSDILPIVRRIHNAVKMPIQLEGRELYISASMSVALNRDVDCVEDILANATASLREMKKSVNLGGIQFFSGGIREKAMKLYKLEFDIRKAIQAQEFVLMYQPIIDVTKGNRIAGFEALVRWNQSERGFISPAEFIPIAEETGLIIPMGAQILRMACEQAKKWVDMGYKDIQVAVNFSAKQFALDNLVDDLKNVLLETHLNPRNLKLEITEYTAIFEAEKTIQIMKALSSMGLQISIDDFGTGYSSLSYLKRFPIHTLKMDKSFVDHVADEEEDAAFARMVIGIARSLNLDLIAEGVETREQLEFLKSEGCRLIQGFFFSMPLNPADALAYLEKHYIPEARGVQAVLS
ncbi:MAG: bifunctional diguanylate cyclase/phosphodiesterase [Fibrobacter sp.]|nr:bifunctional diguanylate cyclase/phosphodiesterase [Fibrobacter sp.]